MPVWTAFPSSDYYGSSVTLGLSPLRQSRTSLKPYVSHALGGLFVPLWEFVTPCPILGDAFSPHSWVFVTYSLSLARIRIVIRRSATGSARDRLGTGLQAMQPSPYHAGLAGPRLLRLLCASRFSAMLLSPSLSASGEAADLWDISPIPILLLEEYGSSCYGARCVYRALCGVWHRRTCSRAPACRSVCRWRRWRCHPRAA